MRNDDWKVWVWFPLVLGLSLSCVNKASASVSAAQAKIIFSKLTPGGITFNIKSNSDVQAESSSNTVAVYAGMLKFVKNKNELALVIGHELGHIAHGDYKNQKFDFAAEFAADLYGFNLSKARGYNACRAILLFKRFDRKQIDYTHPSDVDRYNRLHVYCQ